MMYCGAVKSGEMNITMIMRRTHVITRGCWCNFAGDNASGFWVVVEIDRSLSAGRTID